MGTKRFDRAIAILVAVLFIAPQLALAGRIDGGEDGKATGRFSGRVSDGPSSSDSPHRFHAGSSSSGSQATSTDSRSVKLAARTTKKASTAVPGNAPNNSSPTSSVSSARETSTSTTVVSSSSNVKGTSSSSALSAQHELRHRRRRPILIFPWFGYPFFSYTCHSPFWPYFAYNPYCASYGEQMPYVGADPANTTPPYDANADLYPSPSSLYSTPPAKTEGAPSPDAAAKASAGSNQFARQGEEAFKARDYKAAIRAFRHSLVDDPKNGTLVMMLAQALFAVGEYDEAAGATQQAMLLLPEEKWGVVIAKDSQLYTNTQDYLDQLKLLEKAVKEKPDEPALRLELGFQYGYSGQAVEAVRELDKLLELEAQDQLARRLRDLVAQKANKERRSLQDPLD